MNERKTPLQLIGEAASDDRVADEDTDSNSFVAHVEMEWATAIRVNTVGYATIYYASADDDDAKAVHRMTVDFDVLVALMKGVRTPKELGGE